MTVKTCPAILFQNLLLATDCSEFSEGAIREGIRIAKRCSGRISVLAVVETNPEFEALAPGIVEKSELQTRAHMEAVKARAAAEGVECETIVHQGEEPYRFVVKEAEKRRTDAIVMGRRGRKGLMRLLMGSQTARVIGHAPCAVLVVPRAASVEFNRVLIATDGSRFSEKAAAEAVGIARRCGSSVIGLSVAPIDEDMAAAEEHVRAVQSLAAAAGVPVETVTRKGRAFEGIAATAREKGADLIVIGSHGRTGVDRLLMGSVTERTIGLSECAVLVV